MFGSFLYLCTKFVSLNLQPSLLMACDKIPKPVHPFFTTFLCLMYDKGPNRDFISILTVYPADR